MDEIFPADDPKVAVFSGFGLRVRIQNGADVGPGVLRIMCDDPILIAGGENKPFGPKWYPHRDFATGSTCGDAANFTRVCRTQND